MKRDKYFEAKKEYRALKLADAVNTQAQKELGWVELDVPIFAGYQKKLLLRADIANREDAHILQNIIDRFGTTPTSRRKDFVYWSYTSRKKEVVNAKIRKLTKAEYDSLDPQTKKYFYLDTFNFTKSKIEHYHNSIPSFYFNQRVSKYYHTKTRIYDNVLKQEEAEINYFIRKNPLFTKMHSYWYGDKWTIGKFNKKMSNKKIRSAERVIIKKYLDNYIEDYCFPLKKQYLTYF
jgi:hypothetical protein